MAGSIEVNGINLSNYYPTKRSFNSVLYIHKKFFPDIKEKETVQTTVENNLKPNETIRNKKHNVKEKSKYRNSKEFKNAIPDEDAEQTSLNNDMVVGQTIKFAKNIVPIVIPPNGDSPAPVYYTIKTSRRSKKNKPHESKVNGDSILKNDKSMTANDTFRKDNKNYTESCSSRSLSQSSKSSTLDNININQSMCCSLSEISEKKQKRSHIGKRNGKQKFVASESFDALATELLNTSGDARIKIHLMNDSAKDLLYESIRNPVIEAIKESLTEIRRIKDNTDCKIVHKHVQCNTEKLDNIIDKLSCIEGKLDLKAQEKLTPRPKLTTVKASTLEELGEDIVEVRSESSFEGDIKEESILENKYRSNGIKLTALKKRGKKDLGCGEVLKDDDSADIQPDRPNRMPARFCWTDGDRNIK